MLSVDIIVLNLSNGVIVLFFKKKNRLIFKYSLSENTGMFLRGKSVAKAQCQTVLCHTVIRNVQVYKQNSTDS